MKIAITIRGPGGLDAQFDPRFGRAGAFLLVELPSAKVVEEVDNEAANAAHGAGTGAARTLADHSVQAVISGRFGPKAYQALEALGIEMWISPEVPAARDALLRYEDGSLERMKLQRF